ncbi:MAG: coenzyme F420-0:L-glutamate ligase [Chloroflexi bacterium]|nr:coenzyme F420-0:L-glutamate ligase [Chloroflexota bacterium]
MRHLRSPSSASRSGSRSACRLSTRTSAASSVFDRSSDLEIIGLDGIPEVRPGDDLVGLITGALERRGLLLQGGEIVVVTHKIVSKAEGRLVRLSEIEPSPFARRLADAWGRDARHVEVILRESARIVRMDRGLIISETRHGFVCANAGVDASNVDGQEVLCLQPIDPDASAARIREGLRARLGITVGVIISDSFGRAWRNGVINVAIGLAGLAPFADYRGHRDPNGYELRASVLAVADELAAAAELVMGKLARRPVAVIRGFQLTGTPGTARDLVMDPTRDLFR